MTNIGLKNYPRSIAISLVTISLSTFLTARPVSAISITVNIPEKYGEVAVGEKLYFETEVKWPENFGRKDLRVEYIVEDKDGNEVAYLKVLKAIETQASFMDSITISESTPAGIYKIIGKFSDYGDLSQEVTASFKVVSGGVKPQTYNVIIIGLIFIIILLVINNFYSLKRRGKLRKTTIK